MVARGDQLCPAKALKSTALISSSIDLSRCRGLTNRAHGQGSGERQDNTVGAHHTPSYARYSEATYRAQP